MNDLWQQIVLFFFGAQAAGEEYDRRFMQPHVKRLQGLGVSKDDIYALGKLAIEKADMMVTFPGGLFRDMTNAIEAGDTVEQVLKRYR